MIFEDAIVHATTTRTPDRATTAPVVWVSDTRWQVRPGEGN